MQGHFPRRADAVDIPADGQPEVAQQVGGVVHVVSPSVAGSLKPRVSRVQPIPLSGILFGYTPDIRRRECAPPESGHKKATLSGAVSGYLASFKRRICTVSGNALFASVFFIVRKIQFLNLNQSLVAGSRKTLNISFLFSKFSLQVCLLRNTNNRLSNKFFDQQILFCEYFP
jgi:hypothetical protein